MTSQLDLLSNKHVEVEVELWVNVFFTSERGYFTGSDLYTSQGCAQFNVSPLEGATLVATVPVRFNPTRYVSAHPHAVLEAVRGLFDPRHSDEPPSPIKGQPFRAV